MKEKFEPTENELVYHNGVWINGCIIDICEDEPWKSAGNGPFYDVVLSEDIYIEDQHSWFLKGKSLRISESIIRPLTRKDATSIDDMIIDAGVNYTLTTKPNCICSDEKTMRDWNRNAAFEEGAKWTLARAKKAYCQTECQGFRDTGKCYCDSCDKMNEFIKNLSRNYNV